MSLTKKLNRTQVNIKYFLLEALFIVFVELFLAFIITTFLKGPDLIKGELPEGQMCSTLSVLKQCTFSSVLSISFHN